MGSGGRRNNCKGYKRQKEQLQRVQEAEGTIAKGKGGRRNNCKGYRRQKEQLQRVQEAEGTSENVTRGTGVGGNVDGGSQFGKAR